MYWNSVLDEDKLHVKSNSKVLWCFMLIAPPVESYHKQPSNIGKKTSFHQHLSLSAFAWLKPEASFYWNLSVKSHIGRMGLFYELSHRVLQLGRYKVLDLYWAVAL